MASWTARMRPDDTGGRERGGRDPPGRPPHSRARPTPRGVAQSSPATPLARLRPDDGPFGIGGHDPFAGWPERMARVHGPRRDGWGRSSVDWIVMPGSVIVSGARTPIGKLNGALGSLPATDLGGVAIRAALERGGVRPDQVDYVLMGQVLLAGA